MSILRKIDKPESRKENIYEKYGFKYNPFPNKTSISLYDPNPKNNGSIYVPDIRKNEITQFNKILISSDKNPEPKQIAFLMDYATRKGRGIGKTSFLNYQRKLIQKDLGDEITKGTEVMMSVLVSPSPDNNYKKFYSISKLIIESMVDQNLFQNSYYRLKVFTGLIDQRVIEIAEREGLERCLSDNNWLRDQHKSLGLDYDSHSVSTAIKRTLTSRGVNNELATAIAFYGDKIESFRSHYLDKNTETFWKQEANNLLFNDLVLMLDAAGITKFIILFDELEKVVPNQNAVERRNFCDILRFYFMDGKCENSTRSFYHILFVIHPYLQELLVPHWEASGLQRFAALGGDLADNYTVFFEGFDENNSIPLASAYISDALIHPDHSVGFKPFTEGSLKEALKKTLGVPGKFLTLLHTAIEKGVENNWDEIDVEQIILVETPKVEKEGPENETPLADTKTEI